jgi:hypothetical protein
MDGPAMLGLLQSYKLELGRAQGVILLTFGEAKLGSSALA